MIVHDAARAFTAVIDAAFLWVETLAAALTFTVIVVGLAALPLVAPTARTVRRAPVRPAAPTPVPTRRRVPSWAHTEPYDYEEAA